MAEAPAAIVTFVTSVGKEKTHSSPAGSALPERFKESVTVPPGTAVPLPRVKVAVCAYELAVNAVSKNNTLVTQHIVDAPLAGLLRQYSPMWCCKPIFLQSGIGLKLVMYGQDDNTY